MGQDGTCGLTGMVVLTILESASVSFMPILSRAAKKNGSKNLRYTKCHGANDIEHARYMMQGLIKEFQLGGYDIIGSDNTMTQAGNATIHLLKVIFAD
jgi:hypothetical protein